VSAPAAATSPSTLVAGGVAGRRVRDRGRRRPWLYVGACGLIAAVALLALLAPVIAPYAPNQQELRARLQGPSAVHWLGSDQYGRDLLSRLLFGARLSLFVAVVSVGAATVIGAAVGVIAGYYRGRLDAVLMRIADTMLSLPALVFALGLMAMLGAGVTNIIVAIAVAMTPNFARVVRSVALSVSGLEYVTAARAIGLSDRRILARHVLPNCLSPVIVLASVTVARAILIESNLSFLGVGVPPTTVTWGLMANEGQQFLLDAPWVSLIPAAAIMVTVLAINAAGDGLRDQLDPTTSRL
jgi:ABC-type dipeptide/oligopeptide/nickel transport system permease subunit